MIQPLRRVHRYASLVMTAALPALFLAALSVRHPDLPQNPLPGDEMRQALLVMPSASAWDRGLIVTRLRMDPASPGALFVELIPQGPLGAGDVLLYWSPKKPGLEASPERWHLLGLAGNSSRCFALPAGVRRDGGHLVLYSLASRKIIASTELVNLP